MVFTRELKPTNKQNENEIGEIELDAECCINTHKEKSEKGEVRVNKNGEERKKRWAKSVLLFCDNKNV